MGRSGFSRIYLGPAVIAVLFLGLAGRGVASPTTAALYQSVVNFGQGGQVSCTMSSPFWCVWATNQTGGVFTGHYEVAACDGNYNLGVFQCNDDPVCLTCGQDAALFGYASVADKGQPHFMAPNLIYLAVSNPNFTPVGDPVTNPDCRAMSPGAGCDFDGWVFSFQPNSPYLSAGVNLTQIPDGNHGVLFSRSSSSIIAVSERLSDPTNAVAGNLGCFGLRFWNYTVSNGVFHLGSELPGSPFMPLGTCNAMEFSGYFDQASGEFVFMGVPTGNSTWQSNIYGFNPINGVLDVIVPWGNPRGSCDWDEHMDADPSQTHVAWVSTHGNSGFNGYNGCAPRQGIINPPLDLWVATLQHRIMADGKVHVVAGINSATRLTFLNQLGSDQRTYVCGLMGNCNDTSQSSATTMSGGSGQWTGTSSYIYLVKTVTNYAGVEGVQVAF